MFVDIFHFNLCAKDVFEKVRPIMDKRPFEMFV